MFPSNPDGPVSIDSVGYDGDTPLHVFAWRNDLERVQLLVRSGANVNALGEMDETPLHIAVRHQNRAMIEFLLASGANPDIRSEFGVTAREMDEVGGDVTKLLGSK